MKKELTELKKEFYKKFQKHKIFCKGAWGFELDDVWNFFEPHLSHEENMRKRIEEILIWGLGCEKCDPYGNERKAVIDDIVKVIRDINLNK